MVMCSIPISKLMNMQGNDIFVTQEGRLANASTPNAYHFERLIQKYKFVYNEQTTIQDKEEIGEKVLDELHSLNPPGRIWLESPVNRNVFDEVTTDCQAAHICRIFLILEWHPLVSSSEEENDYALEFCGYKADCPKLISADLQHEASEVEEHLYPRDGIPPVLGSILVDFFSTFETQSNE